MEPMTRAFSLPATELNGESHGEFRELEHVRETEFI